MKLHWVLLSVLMGCGAPTSPGLDASSGPEDRDAGSEPVSDGGRGLTIRHTFDGAAAIRGEAALRDAGVGAGLVPFLAMRNLWVVWGGGPPANDDAYWTAFRARYGMLRGSGALPLGLHLTSTQEVGFDCLACHAGELNGVTIIGAPNVRFDLQGLHDDLIELARVAPSFGFQVPPIPWTTQGRTQAAGANDAMGLGLELAQRATGANVQTHQGFQRPPAWWTSKYKDWRYVDGSGPAGNARLMMATLLASRMTPQQLEAQGPMFDDLEQYLRSLSPPPWPFAAPDVTQVTEGRAVFDRVCADCHGHSDGPQRAFPNRLVAAASIGTDPLRASSFTERETQVINASWFGATGAMRATGGYLAPALSGVWATAPYFHNGSVPTLSAVLDPSLRPASFRLGTEYDVANVGWRFTVEAPRGQASIDARKVYDTLAPGLSNAGHRYGESLSSPERSAVLEYLKTL